MGASMPDYRDINMQDGSKMRLFQFWNARNIDYFPYDNNPSQQIR